MKILIIDDRKPIVRSTSIYLKTKGFTDINTLTDSRRVLDYVTMHKPDVILLDLNMPYISGEILIKDIKAIQKETIIYIISADINPETISSCMRSGANDYFTKPVDNKELVAVLKQLIKSN